MAGAGGRSGIAAACLLGLFPGFVVTFNVPCFDEFREWRMFEGLRGDLSGLTGAEKQLFPAGEGDAEGFAGLISDVHRWLVVNSEKRNIS